MKNLLREAMTVEELEGILAGCPVVGLLPRMGDGAWERVGRNGHLQVWLGAIRERAIQEMEEALPELTDALYANFYLTGVRLNFERVYFERRRRLARAAIAVLMERDAGMREGLMGSLMRKAEGVFGEVSWTLPAHVWLAPSGKDARVIDLFAAETANLFGELLNVFGEVMPGEFVKRVKGRLRSEVFENYLEKEWHWEANRTNWNAVCHQGVLGAALAVEEDAGLLARMLHKAGAGRLVQFLEGYMADGGTSEGPGYWSYGFGWFAVLNEQLEKRTRGALSVFEGDGHVRAIAGFGPRMALSNGYCVNFSDSGAKGSPRPSLVRYLGERLGDAGLEAQGMAGYRTEMRKVVEFDHERMDFFYLGRLMLGCPEELGEEAAAPLEDTVLKDLQVVVSRARDERGHLWEFAAKAGHNGEHHNHNDVGSYLLNVDGERVLIEIGAPEYVKDFFSSKRYTFLAARSLGHAVPLIKGMEQGTGEAFGGKILESALTAERARLVMELTGAYPAEAGCKRWVRRMELDKRRGRLEVVDAFELEGVGAVETVLITEGAVRVEGDGVVIQSGKATVRVTARAGTRVREVQRHGYQGHGGEARHVERIVLVPREMGERVEAGYVVEMA